MLRVWFGQINFDYLSYILELGFTDIIFNYIRLGSTTWTWILTYEPEVCYFSHTRIWLKWILINCDLSSFMLIYPTAFSTSLSGREFVWVCNLWGNIWTFLAPLYLYILKNLCEPVSSHWYADIQPPTSFYIKNGNYKMHYLEPPRKLYPR